MEISEEQARAQWFLRNGNGNPERVDIKFWEYMIRVRQPAHWARRKFKKIGGNAGGGASKKRYTDPVWCFTRNGRTVTQLKDGRIVYTAGEHEDWYDSDFCIYNDVVVEDTNGDIEIFIYPDDVFPPTDFHSATLVDGEIYLIGSLGYRELRRPGETQVLRLDLHSFSISRVEPTGETPGWLSHHDAHYIRNENCIEVWGGKTIEDAGSPNDLVPLAGTYRLHMTTFEWVRVA